jgi:hypothetical protein
VCEFRVESIFGSPRRRRIRHKPSFCGSAKAWRVEPAVTRGASKCATSIAGRQGRCVVMMTSSKLRLSPHPAAGSQAPAKTEPSASETSRHPRSARPTPAAERSSGHARRRADAAVSLPRLGLHGWPSSQIRMGRAVGAIAVYAFRNDSRANSGRTCRVLGCEGRAITPPGHGRPPAATSGVLSTPLLGYCLLAP